MANTCRGDASCGVDLISNLSKVADNIRGIAGNMGLRPYEVKIVTVRWTAGYRGEGVPEVVDILSIDPVPLVESISDIDQRLEAFGLDDVGNIQISEISLKYDEDTLLGRGASGADPSEDTEVFYEVSLKTSVQGDPVLRRFTPTSTPTYDPDNLQYTLRLASARGERHRSTGLLL